MDANLTINLQTGNNPLSLKHKIDLPSYSTGEELISSISHGVGAVLSIAGMVLCIVKSALAGSPISIVSSVVFGLMMTLLYSMSCIYHALPRNNAKRIFRVFDHCTIFLLIVGTYVPIILVSVGGLLGWIYFAIVMISAIVGIVFNAIDVDKYEKISLACYLFMGWIIIFAFKPLYTAVGFNGICLLVTGGIIYSIGAIIYKIGDSKKYFHSIWHFFVLGGTIMHFFTIYLYVL